MGSIVEWAGPVAQGRSLAMILMIVVGIMMTVLRKKVTFFFAIFNFYY